MQGRHQSTCKEGKKTIRRIEKIPGVKGVILGPTTGRRGSGRVGSFKLQRKLDKGVGIKGVLTCSYGLQDIAIIVKTGIPVDTVYDIVEKKFKH